MAKLASVFLYPLKSGRGIEVDDAPVERRGIEGDRRWMVVDRELQFVTQRRLPRLCQVEARLDGAGLRLSAPGMDPIAVPAPAVRERVRVRVWSDTVEAAPAAPEAGAWLSAFLGADLRLVHMPNEVVRPVDPDHGRDGDRVSFADGYPLLVISEASLEALNRELPEPLPMNRFRPNLVVSGIEPYAEDRWRRVRIGDVTLRIVKPCARCAITTTDQETAARGREPLRTLARVRPGASGVLFGQNAIPDGPGRLERGQKVDVCERSS